MVRSVFSSTCLAFVSAVTVFAHDLNLTLNESHAMRGAALGYCTGYLAEKVVSLIGSFFCQS